jgi:hypothetical protein
MECLEGNQICAWAEARGLPCGDGRELKLPALPVLYRGEYAHGRRSGEEATAAADLVTRLGEWDECLVVITLWNVWPSSEDWPTFYVWRGAQRERRSLNIAPGHIFAASERGLLTELVTLVMENAWDADVLPSWHGQATKLHAKISHDEWYEIRGTHGLFSYGSIRSSP